MHLTLERLDPGTGEVEWAGGGWENGDILLEMGEEDSQRADWEGEEATL
jgi:hypothetical protein